MSFIEFKGIDGKFIHIELDTLDNSKTIYVDSISGTKTGDGSKECPVTPICRAMLGPSPVVRLTLTEILPCPQ